MKTKEFAQSYLHMRALQKQYFRTKDSRILEQCKTAEKELDYIAKRLVGEESETPLPNQTSLF